MGGEKPEEKPEEANEESHEGHEHHDHGEELEGLSTESGAALLDSNEAAPEEKSSVMDIIGSVDNFDPETMEKVGNELIKTGDPVSSFLGYAALMFAKYGAFFLNSEQFLDIMQNSTPDEFTSDQLELITNQDHDLEDFSDFDFEDVDQENRAAYLVAKRWLHMEKGTEDAMALYKKLAVNSASLLPMRNEDGAIESWPETNAAYISVARASDIPRSDLKPGTVFFFKANYADRKPGSIVAYAVSSDKVEYYDADARKIKRVSIGHFNAFECTTAFMPSEYNFYMSGSKGALKEGEHGPRYTPEEYGDYIPLPPPKNPRERGRKVPVPVGVENGHRLMGDARVYKLFGIDLNQSPKRIQAQWFSQMVKFNFLGQTITVHREFARMLKSIFPKVKKAIQESGFPVEKIGSYAFRCISPHRDKAGDRSLSNHAGLALDWNFPGGKNGYIRYPDGHPIGQIGQYKYRKFVAAMEELFTWGGRWGIKYKKRSDGSVKEVRTGKQDAMHFEAHYGDLMAWKKKRGADFNSPAKPGEFDGMGA